jgi:aspartate kinase
MRVYKFGGASVKESSGIRNLASIVEGEEDNLVIVVSALGKTTNALEKIVKGWIDNDPDYEYLVEDLQRFHITIVNDLFPKGSQVENRINISFGLLKEYMRTAKRSDYDFEYDQIVSLGEVWSTQIVAAYLNEVGLNSVWIDIRHTIITDDNHRDANILWSETSKRVMSVFDFSKNRRYVTQGFIGGTVTGDSTTLGREGSDFTAAVLASILDAERVVVWKDVPGLLNADPKWIPEAEKLIEVSYKEAVEMTFSGAKIIHPKTIKPLYNKGIPLYVKSFIDPDESGTLVTFSPKLGKAVPVFIRKDNQVMISIVPKDFSFALGQNMGRIFHLFEFCGVKVNLVQASAVSVNVAADNDEVRLERLFGELKNEFEVHYNDNVEMITIRHYNPQAIAKVTEGKEILLEQKTRNTIRFILRQEIKELP